MCQHTWGDVVFLVLKHMVKGKWIIPTTEQLFRFSGEGIYGSYA